MSEFNAYSADDYAGMESGEWSFYYGYERTIRPKDGWCDEWCFVAKRSGVEVAVMPHSEIKRHAARNHVRMDLSECTNCLLVGIGMLIERGLLK